MENMVSRKYHGRCRMIFLVLIFGILLLSKVDSTYAVDCTPPGTCPEIASGLSAAVGVAIDKSKNQLYFVEYNAGTLKRINLPPHCGITATPACSTTVVVIASGFSHPEDVELDLAHGFAYMTTRDDPGTTGALWKVNISAGTKSMVTFNLGAPQQLILDLPNNHAYTVGYNDGRLRRIDLTTGMKIPLYIGLGHPVGLAITADKKYAYVTEQDAPARISKIDLSSGLKIAEIIKDGVSGISLTAPFFLAWTDYTQNSLYVVERDPANRVSRVDLVTAGKNEVATGLPWRPSDISVSGPGNLMYATTDAEIVRVEISALSTSDPVFMGVGHIPVSKINDGFATCLDTACILKVRHAPFGGTPYFFANLTNFWGLGATHYEVWVSKDGGPSAPLALSWDTFKWNSTTMEYDVVTVAPAEMGTRYLIPLDLDPISSAMKYRPELWYHPFLIMRWPSGENGTYTFNIKIYQKTGMVWTDITGSLPAALNNLSLRIDNTPPEVSIAEIRQNSTKVEACDIVKAGVNAFTFKITAYDSNGHLYNYGLSAMFGENKSCSIANESYESFDVLPEILFPLPGKHVGEGPLWYGYTNKIVPTPSWSAPCNCAYTFYLGAWKRTIDGWNWIIYRDYHKSITIDLPGLSKCTPTPGCTP